MKDDKRVRAEVQAALGEFAAAYEKRSLDKVAALFAPNSRVVTLAAKAAEIDAPVTELRAAFKNEWAQHKAGGLKFGAQKISCAGSKATVKAEAILYHEAAAGREEIRAKFTAGLEKSGDKWQFNQVLFALPAGEKASAHAAAGRAAAAGQAASGHEARGYTTAHTARERAK